MTSTKTSGFEDIVESISEIGFQKHGERICELAKANLRDKRYSIKELPALQGHKSGSAIVINAGPSVVKRQSIQKIVKANYLGTTIAIDGSYIACLKSGLIPDLVVTLDPHPTRPVRWFGDPHFEENSKNDDYFARQDLDVAFRENSIQQNKDHIRLVNAHARQSKFLTSSTTPLNVVARIKEAGGSMYWWNPLVDDPHQPSSLTRVLYAINRLPCINTGGTVGSAAWNIACSILRIPIVAIVGTDLGYYRDNPYEKTQTYYELIAHLGSKENIRECFVEFEFPLTGEKFYTDPTYFWYRKNFIEMIKRSKSQTYNCTEGGTLYDESIECIYLDDFLKRQSHHG